MQYFTYGLHRQSNPMDDSGNNTSARLNIPPPYMPLHIDIEFCNKAFRINKYELYNCREFDLYELWRGGGAGEGVSLGHI